MWQRLRLPIPIQAVTGPLDLFHSPDFVLPPLGGTPAILTVHDLSFLRVPQFFVPGFRQYLERAVTRAARRAAHVLADSASTRRDLVEQLGVEAGRVTVLYPGVEPYFRPVEDGEVLARARARYGLPERFILSVGTLQPRKNLAGLIEAFGRLMSAMPASDSHSQPVLRTEPEAAAFSKKELHLVLVGGTGWMAEDIPAAIAQLGLEKRVRVVGFVEDEDLPAVYSLAEVFAFPSWYEGFGLPVLEAMACGTAVVAADNSSLPEVVGDAGLLVSAGDPAAIAGALGTLLADGSLRQRLSIAGRQRAGQFTWASGATRLQQVYAAHAARKSRFQRQGGRNAGRV